MQYVTDIKPARRKGYFKIYIDGEFAASLDEETVISYGIKTGAECDRWAEALSESQNRKALDYALRYISPKMRTESEIRTALKRREFSETAIAQALAKLKEYSYVDDADYAKRYIAQNRTQLSAKAMKNKLRQKGIPRETLDELHDSLNPQQDLESALSVAQKQLRSIGGSEADKRRKLTQRLLYRGFNYEIIDQAIKAVLEEQS